MFRIAKDTVSRCQKPFMPKINGFNALLTAVTGSKWPTLVVEFVSLHRDSETPPPQGMHGGTASTDCKEVNNKTLTFKNLIIMAKVKSGVVYYSVVQNMNISSKNYKKWFARAKHTETVSFDKLIEHMADHNIGYPRGVVKGVMISFVDCLLELVAESKKVQLGELGTFYLNLTSKSVDKYEDFTAEDIQGCGLRFLSSQTTTKDNLTRSAFSSAMSYRNLNTLLGNDDKKTVVDKKKALNKE